MYRAIKIGPWILTVSLSLYRWPETVQQRIRREENGIRERRAERTYRMLMWWRKCQGLTS